MITKPVDDELLQARKERKRERKHDHRGGVGLALLVVVTAVLLVIPAVSAGSWMQAGYDAARSGEAPATGPAIPDVAFETMLPGFYSDDIIFSAPTGPMTHNGFAYVPVRAMEYDDGAVEELNWTLDGIVRIDLATAEVEPLVEINESLRVAASAMDEERLFLSSFIWTRMGDPGPDMAQPGIEKFEAYSLEDGELLWSWPAPQLFEPATSHTAGCTQPAVADGVVYHACNQRPDAAGPGDSPDEAYTVLPGQGLSPERREAYIVGLDAETGDTQALWTTFKTDTDPDGFFGLGQVPSEKNSQILGISVIGDHLFATQFLWPIGAGSPCMSEGPVPCDRQPSAHAFEAEIRLLAISLDSSTVAWSHSEVLRSVRADAVEEEFGSPEPEGLSATAHVTGTPSEIYLRVPSHPGPGAEDTGQQKADRIIAINPGTGDVRWEESVGEDDVATSFKHGALALSDGSLYTTSTQNIYRIDTDPPNKRWSTIMDLELGERFWAADPVVGEERFYTMADWLEGAGSTLYAVNRTSGEIDWRYEMPYNTTALKYKAWNQNHYVSLGDGVLTVIGGDGTFRVLGTTAASIQPAATASTAYPGTDEQVQVDLSASQPGVHGEATRYKAIWGDGTETGWQNDPVLSHEYEEPGDVTARFIVANDANQTASTTQTFHVGQEAPTEPNWISERFAPGNQDMTFGILGILVAATGGAVGVTQRYRKRSRLQDELEAVEQAYEATKDRPLECEAQLTERKTHARGLVLDGELDEQQFGVVEQRIEELLKGVRMGAMEDEFDFLPHGLVKRAREMLADGTVSSLEREAFLQAVEEDEMLSSRQKAVVRDRIEAWHARDAGGGGGR